MSLLIETLKAVREESLTKTSLEHYHTVLSGFKTDIKLEIATLKKVKAIFMYEKNQTESRVKNKDEWDASEQGQRLIDLIGMLGAVSTQLDSLRSRLYQTY